MASSVTTTTKQYVPFTFQEIYDDIVTLLGNDAVYEGSNLAQIVTAMSYLISSLNVNTVANINETFLPLARKQENVLEIARILSYEGFKKKSFIYDLTITLTSDILEVDKYIIKKYDKFTIGANDYIYFGETLSIFGIAGDIFTISVKEGKLMSYNDTPGLIQTLGRALNYQTGASEVRSFIDIPFENIEDDGIELFLSYSNGTINLVDEKWSKSDMMLIDKEYTFNKQFFRKDDITFGTPKCYFKLGGVGNTLPENTVVKSVILESKGAHGGVELNTDGSKQTVKPANDMPNVVFDYFLKMQGSDAESASSVRTNAQLFNNTANRVISAMDYMIYCNSQGNVRTSRIWGGDEEFFINQSLQLNQRPGEIWFSMLPSTFIRTFTESPDGSSWVLDNVNSNSNWFLQDAEISNPGDALNPGLWDRLEYFKIPTMTFFNRNPIFLDFDFDIKILKYNVTKSKEEINKDVFNVIDDYFKSNDTYSLTGEDVSFIEQFNCEFFFTNLVKRINERTTDASGFTLNLVNHISIYDANMTKDTIDPLFPKNPVNLANIDISFALEFPYEGILDSQGYLITSRLPDITGAFIGAGSTPVEGNLEVDYSLNILTDLRDTSYITNPIHLTLADTSYLVGKYEIFNDFKKTIKVTLYAQDDTGAQGAFDPNGVYSNSCLVRTMFSAPLKLPISFYSPNFRVRKNTVPRLNKVVFNA